jgi:transcription initiation factor TFIIB
VLKDKVVDTGPEYRVLSPEDMTSRVRVGKPVDILMHNKGLPTEIGYGPWELTGISHRKRLQLSRMIKWQRGSLGAEEVNLRYALGELARVASFLGLSKKVQEESAVIYRNIVQKRLGKGRSIDLVVASAIYLACRLHSVPRMLKEIAEAANLPRRDLGRTCRFIKRSLQMKVPPSKASEYIPRFASELGTSGRTEIEAMKILAEAEKMDIASGKGPMGLAAAALYIATLIVGEEKTQKDVAKATGITEVTIRNRFREIVSALGLKEKIKVEEEGKPTPRKEEKAKSTSTKRRR